MCRKVKKYKGAVFLDYVPGYGDRHKLVKQLSIATMTAECTVYRWLSGDSLPPKLKRQVIADVMGVPIEKLFPDETAEKHRVLHHP